MPTTGGLRFRRQTVEDAATETLREFYRAVAGENPSALRAYRDDDALLLLLRFDPERFAAGGDEDAHAEATFMAMLEMVAEVLASRCEVDVEPGTLSVCASRGLAVFALRVAALGREVRREPIGETRWGRGFEGGLRLAS